MTPPTRLWTAARSLAVRTRPTLQSEALALRVPRRHLTDDAGNETTKPSGERSGQPKPDEPSQREFAAMFHNANMQGALEAHGLKSGGLTPRQEKELYEKGVIPPQSSGNEAVDSLQEIASGLQIVGTGEGHKFPLPELPLPWYMQMKNRYHPVLTQISRLLMRHGKLSKAQSDLARVLNILRTSPPPILSPKYPLLPGAPPSHHLPLNPVVYLTLAIDSVAPLMRIRHLRGAAGGGQALELPIPLQVRQRRRIAFQWILDAVTKKPSMGSGRDQFAHRLAGEIIAVVEGRSPVWDRRGVIHKVATAARANLNHRAVVKKKK